jgi:hypothetical protein
VTITLAAVQNGPNDCGFMVCILWHELGSSAAAGRANIKGHDYSGRGGDLGDKPSRFMSGIREEIRAVRDERTSRKPPCVSKVFTSIYRPTPYLTVAEMPFHWGLGNNCFANGRSVGASVCAVGGQIGLFQLILVHSHVALATRAAPLLSLHGSNTCPDGFHGGAFTARKWNIPDSATWNGECL